MIRKAVHLSRRIGQGLSSRWRNRWLRLLGVRIDGYLWIRRIEIPRNHRNIRLDSCSLDAGVVLLCLGDDSPGIRLSVGRGGPISTAARSSTRSSRS